MKRAFHFGTLALLPWLPLMTVAVAVTTPQSKVPQLTAVEPKIGTTTPGTKLTVYGTGFSPDAVVYIGGLQVRDFKLISPSTLEVVTPYLRPGLYQLQLKSGGSVVRSEATFMALSSPVDLEIDHAISLAEERHTGAAIAILTAIAKMNTDYQVRAFAHYQIGQTYFAAADFVKWGWALTFLDADKSGMAVQTSWRYGLDNAESTYFLNSGTGSDYDLRNVDIVVNNDVTNDPEPRFFRSLVNARYGNLQKAKIDSDFILSKDPSNPSYQALATYIAVLASDKRQLPSFSEETTNDARALSLLGEATYLSGDPESAKQWWALAAKKYPPGAGLAYWAGKKHLAHGQRRVATALLVECITMAPNSKEAKEANELLRESQGPTS